MLEAGSTKRPQILDYFADNHFQFFYHIKDYLDETIKHTNRKDITALDFSGNPLNSPSSEESYITTVTADNADSLIMYSEKVTQSIMIRLALTEESTDFGCTMEEFRKMLAIAQARSISVGL